MILEKGLINTLQKDEVVQANKHLFIGYDMSKEEKNLLIEILVLIDDYRDKPVNIFRSDGAEISEKDILRKIAPMRRKHMLFHLEGLVELGVIRYRISSYDGENGEYYSVTFKGGMKYV